MDLRALIKFCSYPPEPAGHVEALEKHLGVTLPALLKQIYAIGDEAHAGPIKTISRPALHFDFHAVRKAHGEYYGCSVAEARQRLISIYPRLSNVVPIGSPGNGDQVCLDFREPVPSVVMFDHEIAYRDDEPFHPLARNFDELLAGISAKA